MARAALDALLIVKLSEDVLQASDLIACILLTCILFFQEVFLKLMWVFDHPSELVDSLRDAAVSIHGQQNDHRGYYEESRDGCVFEKLIELLGNPFPKLILLLLTHGGAARDGHHEVVLLAETPRVVLRDVVWGEHSSHVGVMVCEYLFEYVRGSG